MSSRPVVRFSEIKIAPNRDKRLMNSEQKQLVAMVDDFARQMKEKLLAKEKDGWTGWRETHYRSNFQRRLVAHAIEAIQGDNRQWVDVANFAAFLNYLRKRTTDHDDW